MKKLFLIILLCGLFSVANSQNALVKDMWALYQSLRTYDYKNPIKKMDLKDIQGSPYFNDNFIEGEVTNVQGITYIGIQLRYNVYNDQMEFLGPEKEELQIGAPEIIKALKIGKDQFIYTPYVVNKITKKGYFQCLNEGELLLLKKHEILYQKPGELEAFKDPEPAKFIKKTNPYYLRNGNTAAIPINGTKSLLEVLDDKQNEIQSFIKKEKLNVKKEDDLLKLVSYYCSLK